MSFATSGRRIDNYSSGVANDLSSYGRKKRSKSKDKEAVGEERNQSMQSLAQSEEINQFQSSSTLSKRDQRIQRMEEQIREEELQARKKTQMGGENPFQIKASSIRLLYLVVSQ
jgi:hypothetical protein